MNTILIKPIITERSMMEASRGRFTFRVDLKANKQEIKNEVAKVFNVHPIDITTIVVKGKVKRSMKTRKTTKQSNWKKAVVSLKQGEKIDLFDVGGQNA